MVVFDLLDFLEVVITKVQEIVNKLCVLNFYIPWNLVSNTNSSQELPGPKSTHSAFSLLNNFSHPSDATLAISLALSKSNPRDLRIS